MGNAFFAWRGWLWVKRLVLIVVLVIVWFASGIAAVAGVYYYKKTNHINLFANTGFHGVMDCIATESQKIEFPISKASAPL